MALAGLRAGPSWLRWLTVGASAILALNTFVLYMDLPSAAALPGNVAFSIWLGGASVALWRFQSVRGTEPLPAPA